MQINNNIIKPGYLCRFLADLDNSDCGKFVETWSIRYNYCLVLCWTNYCMKLFNAWLIVIFMQIYNSKTWISQPILGRFRQFKRWQIVWNQVYPVQLLSYTSLDQLLHEIVQRMTYCDFYMSKVCRFQTLCSGSKIIIAPAILSKPLVKTIVECHWFCIFCREIMFVIKEAKNYH